MREPDGQQNNRDYSTKHVTLDHYYRKSLQPLLKESPSQSLLSPSSPSSSSLSSPSLEEECHLRMEASPPPIMKHCQCPKDWKHRLENFCLEITSFFITLPIVAFFTLVALLDTVRRRYWLEQAVFPSFSNMIHQQQLQQIHVDEQITQDEAYYARRWGYHCQKHELTTQDGYILVMYRFSKHTHYPQHIGERRAVLIGHGLFQCSGDFVLNEKDSLVFTLVDEGYDVWTGNNRSVGSLAHTSLAATDACYWNWGLKELGLCDLPAMLDHIRLNTGQQRIGYIGHSQGNAQAFIALSLKPELASKLSCFIALAPAVVAGTLITTFPLRLLIHLDRRTFRILFGNKAFLGMMTTAQRRLPPAIMCTLAYSVFSYLFAWWDHHWVKRRKIKYFQFTPRPVSTQLLSDWLEGWGKQGVCSYIRRSNHHHHHLNTTTAVPTSDVEQHCQPQKATEKIPLTIIYGADDYLVDGAAFVRSFEGYERHGLEEDRTTKDIEYHQQHGVPATSTSKINQHSFSFPTLKLVHVERIPAYEHMDTIWAHDNHITTYPIIVRVLKKAHWVSNE